MIRRRAPTSGSACNDEQVVHLSLGTAQWGNSYGVTNDVGLLSNADIASIVAITQSSGIDHVDTAAGYGDAQLRLRSWAKSFIITTKVSGEKPEGLPGRVEQCLRNLDVRNVDGLLIHDWDALHGNVQQVVVSKLGDVVEAGLATRVGVSVYDEYGIASAVDVFGAAALPIGVLQVPANVLDRRLDLSALLLALSETGTRVQVRSVFLQGLLATRMEDGLGLHPDVLAFHNAARKGDRDPVTMALRHVRALPWADEIVVGVTSADELKAIVDAWVSADPLLAPTHLASGDLNLLDPRLW